MKKLYKKIYDKKSSSKILEGINKIANAVGSTMGARGRNVILSRKESIPVIINDGVSIANEFFLENELEDIGVQLVKESANRTNMTAGDGTSATIVLARAIIEKGLKAIENGINPVVVRNAINFSKEKILKELESKALQIESVEDAVRIATISVKDSFIGDKIGELVYTLGSSGAVTIKDSLDMGIFTENVKGLKLEGQLVGGVVENQNKWETRFENPFILLLENSPEDHEFEYKWVPFIQKLAEGKILPSGETVIEKINVPNLIIISNKLSRRFIMSMNANKELIKWAWFRPNTANLNMKEIYKDINSVIGGVIVGEESGVFIEKINIDDLGRAESVVVGRNDIIITNKDSDSLIARIKEVEGQMINAEDNKEQEQIKDRLANLKGGVATVRIATPTEQETFELKLRIEDAVNATKSAMESGYVAGGGVALLNCVTNKPNNLGEEILFEALKAPFYQILDNAGIKLDTELKDGEGINVITNEKVDMVKAGIVDPLKVVQMSLINAVSIAELLLTSEYVITEVEDSNLLDVKNLLNGKKD